MPQVFHLCLISKQSHLGNLRAYDIGASREGLSNWGCRTGREGRREGGRRGRGGEAGIKRRWMRKSKMTLENEVKKETVLGGGNEFLWASQIRRANKHRVSVGL